MNVYFFEKIIKRRMNSMTKKKKFLLTIGLTGSMAFLTACGASAEEGKLVTLGVVGENQEVWDFVAEKLEEEHDVTLKLVKFTDYAQPNNALKEKEIDLNAFQHQLFLDSFNEDSDTKLTTIGKTVIAPLGVYSEKISDIKELKAEDVVAIPNDVTNGGRALLLLQTAGLI